MYLSIIFHNNSSVKDVKLTIYMITRNGNIRKFLAQKAAYVSHGSGSNEEINLYGLDGSKPGAASAGVWLSHKVIGKNFLLVFYRYAIKYCKT